LRDKVLPAHIYTYFPQDLETFLKHSSPSQLQTYVSNYRKAINTSIKQHSDQSIANTRNILTYPGFQRDLNPTNPAQLPLSGVTILGNQPEEPTPANNADNNNEMNPLQHPPTLPPPAPNEDTPAPLAPAPPRPPLPTRKRIQQSILATFRRKRTTRETTTTSLDTPSDHPTINITLQSNNNHQTVGDYITQMTRPPTHSNTSTAETDETTTTPVIATRASPH